MQVVELPDLVTTLGLGHHEHLAVVGAGGKTTIAAWLARGLSGRRVLTTTTKMGRDQDQGWPVLVDPSDDELTRATAPGVPVVAWGGLDEQKAVGVSPERCDRWFDLLDHVVIEADGARRRLFKAPAPYEPVVPSTTTTVVSVIGAAALGRPIGEVCHRPELVAALAGADVGDPLTIDRAAAVLTHRDGFRRAVPAGARIVVAVSRVDDRSAERAAHLASSLAAAEPSWSVIGVADRPDIAGRTRDANDPPA